MHVLPGWWLAWDACEGGELVVGGLRVSPRQLCQQRGLSDCTAGSRRVGDVGSGFGVGMLLGQLAGGEMC